MAVWEAWNVQYLSCQPYISLKAEYPVCGKHVYLDTPTAVCCVRHLSLIGPNSVCRVCAMLVSRILDVEREVCQEYFSQK
jgi:predicted kinase